MKTLKTKRSPLCSVSSSEPRAGIAVWDLPNLIGLLFRKRPVSAGCLKYLKLQQKLKHLHLPFHGDFDGVKSPFVRCFTLLFPPTIQPGWCYIQFRVTHHILNILCLAHASCKHGSSKKNVHSDKMSRNMKHSRTFLSPSCRLSDPSHARSNLPPGYKYHSHLYTMGSAQFLFDSISLVVI